MTLTQPSLLDALARNSDPDTSHTAAAAQTPARRQRGQRLVLAALAEHGPLTDFEHEAINGLQQTSAGKRRLELLRRGLVEYAGARRADRSVVVEQGRPRAESVCWHRVRGRRGDSQRSDQAGMRRSDNRWKVFGYLYRLRVWRDRTGHLELVGDIQVIEVPAPPQ